MQWLGLLGPPNPRLEGKTTHCLELCSWNLRVEAAGAAGGWAFGCLRQNCYMQWCCSLFFNALLAVISIGYENAIRREATSDFGHVNVKLQRRLLAVVVAITRNLSVSAPMFYGE